MNPPIEPSFLTIRWQGTTSGKSLFRITDATARAAAGRPDIRARSEYETTLPHCIDRAVCKTRF